MKNVIEKRHVPFTQISNVLLNSKTLSLKAKGLYAYMYSKPNAWNFTTVSMATQLKEGREAIMTALNELKNEGWLSYEKKKDGSGVYLIEYEPKAENPTLAVTKDETQSRETPLRENPTVVKPDSISNIDLNSNTDSFNNIDESKERTKEEILIFYETIFKEKFKSKISYHSKSTRIFNLNAIGFLLDEKGIELRDFLRHCLSVEDVVLKKRLRPAEIWENLTAFSVVLSEMKITERNFVMLTRMELEVLTKGNWKKINDYEPIYHNREYGFARKIDIIKHKLNRCDQSLVK